MSGTEQQTNIVVVGAGSTACALLPILAAMPAVHLRLVDGDTVSRENLVRQTLYGSADVGRMKVEVAAARLAPLAAPRTIIATPVFLDAANARSLLQGAALVCDCTDDLHARRLVAATCAALELPLVWGAVHGAQFQVGSKAGNAHPNEVFEGMPAMEQDGCDMSNVPAHTTGAAASLMAMHADALLKAEERLCGVLELLDMTHGRWLRLRTADVMADATDPAI